MSMPSQNVLLITGGRPEYASRRELIAETFRSRGLSVTLATEGAAVNGAREGGFNAVVLYTEGSTFLNAAEVETLAAFVRGGGGLVAIQSAAEIGKSSETFAALLGARPNVASPVIEFKASVSDTEHPIAHRVQDFRIADELYGITPIGAIRPFLSAMYHGKPQPLGFSKEEGSGKVVYLAFGNELSSLKHPTFQQLLTRSVRFAAGEDWTTRTVNVGAIGYGGAFNMGKLHLETCARSRMRVVAVCDTDFRRAATAKSELGEQIQTYTSVDDFLGNSDAQMVINITPHNLHAPLSIRVLESGRHSVTEKPFTITVDEATQVLETARRMNKMATVFHNRRWDGDFQTIKQIIDSGVIGDVFSIETYFGNYGEPRTDWWRSSKTISGGAFYDWGAHFVDWVLNLMPHRIESISGQFHKRQWLQVDIEDHTEATVRFEGGRTARFEQSSISAIDKAKWRILGTLGGIEQVKPWDEKAGIRVVHHKYGMKYDGIVPILKSDWDGFYRNVADHLMLGEPLAVTPESARNVISVLALAEESSKCGGAPMVLPYEQ